jgi:uncharacterized membrane protein YdjX (TVP38/TMEM64 family)
VFLLRLLPFPPFALTNLMLAAAKVRRVPFTLGTLVGLMPQTAVLVFVASQADDVRNARLSTQQQLWLLAAGVAAALFMLALVGRVARRALAQVTAGEEVAPLAP